jgi:hypothetical protein
MREKERTSAIEFGRIENMANASEHVLCFVIGERFDVQAYPQQSLNKPSEFRKHENCSTKQDQTAFVKDLKTT